MHEEEEKEEEVEEDEKGGGILGMSLGVFRQMLFGWEAQQINI